jgi:hypothetical protein
MSYILVTKNIKILCIGPLGVVPTQTSKGEETPRSCLQLDASGSNQPRFGAKMRWAVGDSLTCFEQMSGMKINYHKSGLMTVNVDTLKAHVFAQFLL